MSRDAEGQSSLKRACRKCKYILSEDDAKCPVCGSSDLSEEWSGIIIIVDPSAQLAEAIGAKRAGRYAIKVR
uniref:Transcription elongation factor Spt4 n=1 Tax=Candidatus Methanomethylicus mesodigestus TaxID=1867258 RepID=A0A7C3J2G9_9CREN